MNIGFLFGAGAEIAYNMPSGGKFALEIFRRDSSEPKEDFKKMRESIDSTTHYAGSWLPDDYKTRSIGTFGRSVFESIIKDTIEHNRDIIVDKLNNFDGMAKEVAAQLHSRGLSIDNAVQNITGRTPRNIGLGQDVAFIDEFSEGNRLFANNYFSALLFVYKERPAIRVSLGKIIIAILQLQVGALGEKLSKRINENLFKKKKDDIDLFDDLGEIIQLNYRSSGVTGLEYLLDATRADVSTDEGVVLYFAQEVLENIFASVLDYKTLIDSNWHYLYLPKTEWTKFCKISIFLLTVKDYIEQQCREVNLSAMGYYNDLKQAVLDGKIEETCIATTNYTSLISSILGDGIHYLNGSTAKWYDPYVNRILTEEEISGKECHFVVPLLFTQSGTKPITSIGMSIEYVDVYRKYQAADCICSIGFGFNADDEHINGMIRTLVDEGKKLIVVEPQRSSRSCEERAEEIAERLKVTNTERIKVLFVDRDTRTDKDGLLWTDVLPTIV